MKKMSQSIRKTIAVLLSIVFSSTVAFGSMPTVAYAALDEDDEITLVFAIGDEGAAYNNDIAGYDFEAYTYTATSVVTETSEGAEVTLLAKPDTLPEGKQFVGWRSTDGQWIEGSTVKLSALASARDGQSYTFTAVYNDYIVNYDLDGGEADSEALAELSLNPEDSSYARAGFDAEDTYTPIAAESIVGMKSGYSEFVGWALNGNTDSMIEGFGDYDFETYGGVVNLQAIYGQPITIGTIAYCNAFDGLDEIDELSDIANDDLIAVEDGVSAYTVETGEISPVPNVDSTPRGQEFISWDVYAVSDMTTKLGDGVTTFNTTGRTADLVFVASFADAEYDIEYLDPDGEDFDPELAGVTTSYTYNATEATDITLPAIQTDAPDETHVYAWYDGENYYAGGATYTIESDTVGAITFQEVVVNIYSISYSYEGGTAPATANPETWTVTDGAVALSDATPADNYNFAGWFLADSTTFVDPDDPITDAVTALDSDLFDAIDDTSIALEAGWEGIPRTITLTGLIGIDDESYSELETLGFELEYDDDTNPTTLTATITKTVEDALIIPAVTKDGYRFIKWDDGNATTTQDDTTVVFAAGDITDDFTYAAVFAEEYTLTLSGLRGITEASVTALEEAGFVVGTGTRATLAFIADDTAFNLPVIAKDGYDFMGWYNTATGSPTTASTNVEFDPSVAADKGYAAYFVRSHAITFMDGDTVLDDPAASTYLTGTVSITLPAVPAKAGYTANGWVLQGDETSTLYSAGTLALYNIGIEDVEDEVDLVFVADYTIITYDVTYMDGDDELTDLADTYTVEDGSITLAAGPDKTGNDFLGWQLDGAGDNLEGASSYDTTTGDLVFKTNYQLQTYNVTYYDGETELTSLAGTYTYGDASITLAAAQSANGYNFLGWQLDGTGDNLEGASSYDVTSGDLTFYTHWSLIDRTIALTGLIGIDDESQAALEQLGFTLTPDDADHPTALTATITKTIEDALTIPAVTRNGYRFIKWDDNDGETEDDTTVVLAAGDIEDDLTYAAVFDREYTLTLSGLRGITEESAEALETAGFVVGTGTRATLAFTANDTAFTLPLVAKDGYDFLGWYDTATNDSSTASTNVEFDPSTAANKGFTAYFVRSHSVTFMDGETVLDDPAAFTYLTGAASITLPAVPVKTGYTANGWVLQGDESAVKHGAGALTLSSIGIETYEDEVDLVFVADYTITSRTITLTGLIGIDDESQAALEELGFTLTPNETEPPTTLTATITKTIEDALEIPAITKDSYRFIKWDDDDTDTEDGTTISLAAGDITDNLTYAAVFAEEYALTLSGLDGITDATVTALGEAGFTVNDDNTATLVFVASDEAFVLPTVAKDGYDFIGWYETVGNDPTTANTNVNFSPSTAADAGYTARFTRSYTVTFMDGETVLDDPAAFTYLTGATSITLPAVPVKGGYTANGWILQGDETNTLREAGTLTLSTIGIEGVDDEVNLVFIADYTIIDNTITLAGLLGVDDDSLDAIEDLGFTLAYDDNDNPTTLTATITKTAADALEIPAITKLHFAFDGWQETGSTDSPAATVTLDAGDITSDLTYTATFSNAKAITVNFDLDGGAFQVADITGWDTFGYAASTSETITAYADDDFTAIAEIPAPVKDDYVFTGWTVGTSTDKVMSYSLPTPDDQTIALTATWVAGTEGETVVETEGNAAATIDAGTVSDIKDALDENVGTGETSVTKLFIEEDLAGAHDGSTLEGKADEAFDGATAATITKTYVDIDITQYITSDTENSTAHDIHDLGCVVDIAYTPTSGVANLKAVVREHDGTPKTYTRFRQLTAAPTTLEDGTYFIDDPVVHIYTRFFSTYALGYATGVYKVTFDVNGGNETYDDVYTDQLGTLPTPTKSGDYTFQKWTYADGSTATAGDTITADTALTAQWTYTGGGGGGGGVTPPPTPPTTDYTITFNADGGVAVTSITVTDGKLPTLPVTTKEGSTFDGWFYADGSKAAVGDAISSDITLKAGWTVNGTFTVYFDADGGKAVESITVTDGKLPELPTTTKDKNTFNGWFYASGTKAVAGDPITENVTLKASWTPDETPATFTVTFDSKGGSAVSSISVSDAKLPTLPASTRDKYTLDGWFYADGTQAKAGDAITADTILTAKWTKVKEPAPTEIVPTKNGVVVAVNSDGAKTVTLIDGSKYGKKATINTVVGTDKQKYKVTRIYDEAFKGNATITKVVIGANVLAIGDNAFEDCTGLKTVTFGKNLATIGDNAFDGCTSLTAAKLGNSVKTIGDSAFDGCTSLKTLSIGTGVTSIGVDAFNGCTSLATLTIGMADIPDGLFAGYTSLTKVSMGKTVKTIGDSAFEGCTSLKTASLGSKVEHIGDSAFQNDGKVKSIKIGANVKSIGDYAFAGCVSLKSAVLGKTVATVGDYAFSGCTSMTTTTIGKAVATLGDGVYAGNAKLGTVKVNSTNLTKSEAVGDNFLSGIKATATIKITKSVFDQTKAVFEEKSGAGAQVKYRK
ncbi:InlB B-repeat-containing protein [Candidatus Saccharibacteria bacterium]|nr:InlB B-repeat-containing protein [Candidatus Saccharibacteria bacterium]